MKTIIYFYSFTLPRRDMSHYYYDSLKIIGADSNYNFKEGLIDSAIVTAEKNAMVDISRNEILFHVVSMVYMEDSDETEED